MMAIVVIYRMRHPAAMKRNPRFSVLSKYLTLSFAFRGAEVKTAKNEHSGGGGGEESACVGGFSAGNCRALNEWRLVFVKEALSHVSPKILIWAEMSPLF